MQDNFSIKNWKNTVVYKEEFEGTNHYVKYSSTNDTFQVWKGEEIITDFVTKERAEAEAKRLNNLDSIKRMDRMQEEFDRSMLDKFELDVYGYQTQHFDICPGAQSLYQDILDGKYGDKDKTTVKTLARLQDDLFNMEKKALAYGEVDNSFLEIAEKLESQIYRLADGIGLRDEHDYITNHIDRIARVTGNPEDALGEQEEMEDEPIELEIPDEDNPAVDVELQDTMSKNDKVIKTYKDIQDKMQASLKNYKEAQTTEEKEAAKEELKALTPIFQSAKKAYEKIKAVKI